jgi:DNA sulfur modification protein DndD
MTFLEIALENLGPFYGRHTLKLDVDATRNVILVGALNGSGKTTLLNAFQLVLYGRDSLPGQSAKNYQHYLAQLINNQAPLHESASVDLTLAFEDVADGAPLRVQRRWWRSERNEVREQLTVWKGSETSEELTQNWDTFIANVLPARVADLFFLDGEKIEALTEPDQAASIIRKGIYTLLELDRIEELRANLRVVRRRRLNSIEGIEGSDELRSLEDKVNVHRGRRSELLQERASLANVLDRANLRSLAAERAFRESGGELFERRERWARRQTELQAALRHVSDQLRQLASRELPLLMCAELVDEGISAVKRSDEASRLLITIEAIRERDKEYVRILKELGLPSAMGKSIAAELAHTVPVIPANAPPTNFGVRSERLDRYAVGQRKRLHKDAIILLKEADKHRSELAEVDQAIESVPSEDQIVGLARELKEANHGLAGIQATITGLDEQIARLDRQVDDAQKEVDSALSTKMNQNLANAEAERVVRHVEFADKSLEEYLVQMVGKYSGEISERVLKSFGLIARKAKLLSSFEIDPQTFRMKLRGAGGKPLNPGELSAGERQILAVAILDGLAKSAGRQIPTLIDSPLGRLDGIHRRRIAEHYLPNASHQTIIFSTDKEVDEQMMESLKDHIAASYLLTFNERDHGTQIESGYFKTR